MSLPEGLGKATGLTQSVRRTWMNAPRFLQTGFVIPLAPTLDSYIFRLGAHFHGELGATEEHFTITSFQSEAVSGVQATGNNREREAQPSEKTHRTSHTC